MRRFLDARHAGCVALLSLLILAATPPDAAGDTVDPRWDTVIARLDAVHEAFATYEGPDGFPYPRRLSALYPDFISDPSLLLDPFRRPPSSGGASEHARASLGYRMVNDILYSDAGGIEARGGHYPLLYAGRQRGLGVLNMSLTGHLYYSPVDWAPLAAILGEASQEVDEEAVAAALDGPAPPEGYALSARMIHDLGALSALLAQRYGDTSARYHAEGLLRAWGHDDEGAASALTKAVTKDPTNIRALFHYARVLDHHVGRRANAIDAYEHVVATGQVDAPQWRDAHRRLSKLYARVGASQKHRDLIETFADALTPGAAARQALLVRMYVDASQHARAVETAEAFLDADARTDNRALAAALADASGALGALEAATRYRTLAHPALGLVGEKAPRFIAGRVRTGKTPVLLSVSRGDGGEARGAREALFDAIHRDHGAQGLQVVSGTTDGERDADPWWRDVAQRSGHIVLFGMADTYAAHGIEGSATVLVDHDGYVRYASTIPEADIDGLRAAVRASMRAYEDPGTHGTLRVTGDARDERDEPVANATVELYYFDNVQTEMRLITSVSTDSDGAFSLVAPAVPYGEASEGRRFYHVIAQAEGQAAWTHRTPLAPSQAETVRIRFERPRVVRGRVTDGDGAPAVGVRVAVRSVTSAPRAGAGKGRARTKLLPRDPSGPLVRVTDGAGRYTFEALPERAKILLHTRHPAYADGYAWFATHEQTEVDIVLHHGATIEGTVYYADLLSAPQRESATAPGVTVSVRQVVPPALAAVYGDAEWQTSVPVAYGASVETDARGRYRIERVPHGYMDLYTDAPGHTAMAWKSYRISEGESHAADMYLIEGGIVDGVVVDEDTGEVVGSDFRAVVRMLGAGGMQTAAIAEGRFHFRAAPGANYLTMFDATRWEVLDTPDRPAPSIVGVVDGETTAVIFRVRRLEERGIPASDTGR